jgi:uncharacterized protein YndB with AHSA1/START domain
VTGPIEIEFEVACSPEHAFDTWANKTSTWWPRSHSMTSAPGLVVAFEPRPGGRIFERTPDGAEHDWGEVVAWEPPNRLAYLWHLGSDRGRATEVDISFAGDASATTVTITHRGSASAPTPPPGASATSAAGAACPPTTSRRQPNPPAPGPPVGERSPTAGSADRVVHSPQARAASRLGRPLGSGDLSARAASRLGRPRGSRGPRLRRRGPRWRRPTGRRSPARPGSAGGAGRTRCRWCRG